MDNYVINFYFDEQSRIKANVICIKPDGSYNIRTIKQENAKELYYILEGEQNE